MTKQKRSDSTKSKAHEQARDLARVYLKPFEHPDAVQIRKACEKASRDAIEFGASGEVDLEELVRYFELNANIFVPTSRSLDDPLDDHKEWLRTKSPSILWKFWERYENFMGEVENLPEPILRNLDLETDKILERIEDPDRPGFWDRRGLVVGSVQSGKTGNFLGLTCKALDAGYKLVIVLAGMHNSLRTQTQIRAEEGVLGFDTSKNGFLYIDDNPRVGVGLLKFPQLRVNSMTTREEKGDFREGMLQPTLALGGDPFVIVVKKNVSILRNLEHWLTRRHGVKNEKGDKTVHDIPMLLIDDEADHASINTRAIPEGEDKKDYDVSAINERIRSLLKSFQKSAYVGYTATPFANIFVNPDTKHEKLQDDIFPRSFILNLQAPNNYIGADVVFGRDGDEDAGIEEIKGLPLVRTITSTLPAKYNKHYQITELPATLKEAIRAFVLACAARSARGNPNAHNSMLVHMVRFVAVQKSLSDLVRTELLYVQRRISQEGVRDSKRIRDELRSLWETEFQPKTTRINDYLKEKGLGELDTLEWEDLEPHLVSSSAKIEVREINGTSTDILDYERRKEDGLSVITIGGDKLSRGLTLSGLTVSYYLRVSKMYDTLLQMGRWFGYRDGYLDVCRLYTTDELQKWYRYIALADNELRQEFDRMYVARLSPKEYGLRVRTHPDGLLVTALNKSRCSTTMQVSFAGELVQTATLYKDKTSVESNWKAANDMASVLGTAEPRDKKGRGHAIWSNVARSHVTGFLRSFRAHPGSKNIDGERLAAYIESQAHTKELSEWVVVLVSNSQAPSKYCTSIAHLSDIGLTVRDPQRIIGPGAAVEGRELNPQELMLRNSNIISPPDQGLDFSGLVTREDIELILAKSVFSKAEEERQLIQGAVGMSFEDLGCRITDQRIAAGVIRGKSPAKSVNGRVFRDLRPGTRGLLLIYALDWRDRRPGMNDQPFENVSTSVPVIGFAISFPSSNTAKPVTYKVGEIYRKLHLDSIEAGEDDDSV
jgi:hypothetical protein